MDSTEPVSTSRPQSRRSLVSTPKTRKTPRTPTRTITPSPVPTPTPTPTTATTPIVAEINTSPSPTTTPTAALTTTTLPSAITNGHQMIREEDEEGEEDEEQTQGTPWLEGIPADAITTSQSRERLSANSDSKNSRKAPSLRGSAKFSRRKLSAATGTSTEVLITKPTGRHFPDKPETDHHEYLLHSPSHNDDDDDDDDDIDDIEDDPADISFDAERDPDEEYDTDLEMDIDQWLLDGQRAQRLQDDMTGRKGYVAACENVGVTPASYFMKRIEEKEVAMKFRGLGPDGTKALCVPLRTNSAVEKLDLEGNWIQEPGCMSVANMLSENIYLSDLILSENKIGNDGAVTLCHILCKNDMITKLDLSGNDLTDIAAESICEMLKKNSSLKHLILRHNYFEERGAQHFKDALSTNESLETMDLSWNRFRTRSAILIAEGIQENYGLRCLNFSMNGLGLDGAESMGKALKANRTLLQLDISFNRIPEKGAGYIGIGLQTNDVLQGIKISSNPIGSEGAMVLLIALDRNDSSCVNYLEMMSVRVTEEFHILEEKLKTEKDLVVIHAGVKFEGSPPDIQKIEPTEWWIRDPMTKLRKYIKESGYRIIDLFRDFDKDCNNTISREEFLTGVQQAGIHLTVQQIDELMRKLDKDKNGTIEYTELLEGDKEYRALRRQWAEEKRKQVMIDSTIRKPVNVRSMLGSKEVSVPELATSSSTATATQ